MIRPKLFLCEYIPTIPASLNAELPKKIKAKKLIAITNTALDLNILKIIWVENVFTNIKQVKNNNIWTSTSSKLIKTHEDHVTLKRHQAKTRQRGILLIILR